ncbi:MAG TPA: hypothetical protein VGE34_03570 [Candidatus Saccharimonadales bacterium]
MKIMKKTNINRLIYRLRFYVFTMNNMVIAAGLVIAAGWAIGSVNVMERNFKLQRDLDAKTQELKLVELETETLRYEGKYYQSDEYKELAVRQRLGLGFPGEKAIILPNNSKQAKNYGKQEQTTTGDVQTSTSNTEQWVNFLLGGNRPELHN